MTTQQKVEAFLGAASGRRGVDTWRDWLRWVLYTVEDVGAEMVPAALDGEPGWNEALEAALKAHGIRFCHVLDYLFPGPAEETEIDTAALAWTLRSLVGQALSGPMDDLHAISARSNALTAVLRAMNEMKAATTVTGTPVPAEQPQVDYAPVTVVLAGGAEWTLTPGAEVTWTWDKPMTGAYLGRCESDYALVWAGHHGVLTVKLEDLRPAVVDGGLLAERDALRKRVAELEGHIDVNGRIAMATEAERDRLRDALRHCRNDVVLAQSDLPQGWAAAMLTDIDGALYPADESK